MQRIPLSRNTPTNNNMSTVHHKSDIFQATFNGFVHCANLYHVMGGGIAAVISKRYPALMLADKNQTVRGDTDKLGRFSFVKYDTSIWYNLYGQMGIGNDSTPLGRNVRYDAIHDGLHRVSNHLLSHVETDGKTILAMPAMGCGLAGGDFRILKSIVESVEEHFTPRGLEIHIHLLD
jgi:O-acetyl-ADP-ribose deacetylase (regulator of RNase III)